MEIVTLGGMQSIRFRSRPDYPFFLPRIGAFYGLLGFRRAGRYRVCNGLAPVARRGARQTFLLAYTFNRLDPDATAQFKPPPECAREDPTERTSTRIRDQVHQVSGQDQRDYGAFRTDPVTALVKEHDDHGERQKSENRNIAHPSTNSDDDHPIPIRDADIPSTLIEDTKTPPTTPSEQWPLLSLGHEDI